MMIQRVVVMLVCGMMFAASSAAQGWEVSRTVDDFTDEVETAVFGFGDGNLMLWVGCLPEREVRLAIVGDDDLFQNGTVDIRFESSRAEQFQFIDLDREIVSAHADDERLVARLLREDEVRFRVRRWRNETVTGRFVLDGFAAKMVDAGCPPR